MTERKGRINDERHTMSELFGKISGPIKQAIIDSAESYGLSITKNPISFDRLHEEGKRRPIGCSISFEFKRAEDTNMDLIDQDARYLLEFKGLYSSPDSIFVSCRDSKVENFDWLTIRVKDIDKNDPYFWDKKISSILKDVVLNYIEGKRISH